MIVDKCDCSFGKNGLDDARAMHCVNEYKARVHQELKGLNVDPDHLDIFRFAQSLNHIQPPAQRSFDAENVDYGAEGRVGPDKQSHAAHDGEDYVRPKHSKAKAPKSKVNELKFSTTVHSHDFMDWMFSTDKPDDVENNASSSSSSATSKTNSRARAETERQANQQASSSSSSSSFSNAQKKRKQNARPQADMYKNMAAKIEKGVIHSAEKGQYIVFVPKDVKTCPLMFSPETPFFIGKVHLVNKDPRVKAPCCNVRWQLHLSEQLFWFEKHRKSAVLQIAHRQVIAPVREHQRKNGKILSLEEEAEIYEDWKEAFRQKFPKKSLQKPDMKDSFWYFHQDESPFRAVCEVRASTKNSKGTVNKTNLILLNEALKQAHAPFHIDDYLLGKFPEASTSSSSASKVNAAPEEANLPGSPDIFSAQVDIDLSPGIYSDDPEGKSRMVLYEPPKVSKKTSSVPKSIPSFPSIALEDIPSSSSTSSAAVQIFERDEEEEDQLEYYPQVLRLIEKDETVNKDDQDDGYMLNAEEDNAGLHFDVLALADGEAEESEKDEEKEISLDEFQSFNFK